MGKEAAKKMGRLILVILALIIAFITIKGGLHPNPYHSTFFVYIAIGLPVMLIINVIGVINWSLRCKIWVLIPIIAICANLNYLSSIFQIRDNENKPYNLKVATYNVHSFNNDYSGYSAKEIAKFMNGEKVDILCMQEYSSQGNFNLDSLNYTFSCYPYSRVPKNKEGSTRVAIFSNYPIVAAKFISFKDTHNCAMYCDVQVKDTIVRVFNLHLQTTSLNQDLAKKRKYNMDATDAIDRIENSLIKNAQIRTTQAEYICKIVKDTPYPIVMGGDFNAMPSTYEYHIISELLSDGFKTCGNGYAYTYQGMMKLMRIDYIFTSFNIDGTRYYSPSKKWSDHNPVIMEMNVK